MSNFYMRVLQMECVSFRIGNIRECMHKLMLTEKYNVDPRNKFRDPARITLFRGRGKLQKTVICFVAVCHGQLEVHVRKVASLAP